MVSYYEVRVAPAVLAEGRGREGVLHVCLECAARGTDDDLVAEYRELSEDVVVDDLYCELCGGLVAKASSSDTEPS